MTAMNEVNSQRSTPTARPWYVDQVFESPIYITARTGKAGEGICMMDGRLESRNANAAHIVHCVNTHDALVEALSDMISMVENWGEQNDSALINARTVIAKVKGGVQ